MRRSRAAVVLALLLAGAVLRAPRAAAAPDDALDGLLRRFAAMPGLSATFHEEKRFALLEAPLASDGTLHFAPSPPRFARHTRAPVASTLLVLGDRLVFGDDVGEQTLDLGARPAVRPFVDSFLAVLAGDRTTLERIHRLELTPRPDDAWRLVLRPRVSPMDKAIDRLELEGKGVLLARMLLVEVGGDETETTFTDVDPAHVYSPEEAATVFRLPARGRRP